MLIENFANDLSNLAWAMHIATETAQQQIAAFDEPRALAECIRCQLLETTMSTFLDGYIPELIAQALVVDLWPPALAVSIASKITNKDTRAHLCVDLLSSGKLTAQQQRDVVQMALQALPDIPFENSFIPVYSGIIPYADETQREQILHMALAMTEEGACACVLRDLVPGLQSRALEQVIQRTQDMEDPGNQATVLSTLLPHLSPAQQRSLLGHALDLSYESYDEFNDEKLWYTTPPDVISHVASVVAGETLVLVLNCLESIPEGATLVEVLCNLIPHVPEDTRLALIEKALMAAQRQWQLYVNHNSLFLEKFDTVGNPYLYAVKPLVAVAHYLPEEQRAHLLEPLLAYVLTIENTEERASLLAGLFPGLLPAHRHDFLEDAVHSALTIEHETWRAEILSALAPYLAGEALEIALQGAETISFTSDRVNLLCNLAPRLNQVQLERVLQEASGVEGWQQKQVFCALIPYLTGEQQTQALRNVLQLQ